MSKSLAFCTFRVAFWRNREFWSDHPSKLFEFFLKRKLRAFKCAKTRVFPFEVFKEMLDSKKMPEKTGRRSEHPIKTES